MPHLSELQGCRTCRRRWTRSEGQGGAAGDGAPVGVPGEDGGRAGGAQAGVGKESLRRGVAQAEVEDVAILKAATTFFGSPPRAPTGPGSSPRSGPDIPGAVLHRPGILRHRERLVIGIGVDHHNLVQHSSVSMSEPLSPPTTPPIVASSLRADTTRLTVSSVASFAATRCGRLQSCQRWVRRANQSTVTSARREG